MAESLNPDLCIVGAGSAGLSLAAAAAQLGLEVVLVEAGRMGGDCLNVGCVPSKALIAAARTAQTMREAARFGISVVEPEVNFPAVMAHVRDVIAQIAPHDSVERFEALGVRVIRATGRFTGPDALEAGGIRIRARRFVLATGSRPALPPVPGLAEAAPLTNETLFELDELPRHLLVLGGGPIGCEMAQAFRRLGAAVTVLDQGPILPREDPELVQILRDRLVAEGITLHERVKVTGAGPGTRLAFEQDGTAQAVEGSHLLVATGRKVVVDGLGLEAAGVAFGPQGIRVDDRLRTSNRRVWAIGDCTGGPQFTHMAGHHAAVVVRNALFRLPARVERRAVPRVTYTDPELAQVGLSAGDEAARGPGVEIVRLPLAENDRARAERRLDGMVKLVVGRRGRVLGASILGAHAGELLLPWVIAVRDGLPLSRIAATIAPYPTLAETARQAAGKYFAPRLFAPRTRAIVRFLSRLGT